MEIDTQKTIITCGLSFSLVVLGVFLFAQKGIAEGSELIPYQIINLEPGWSIVSTPKILLSYEFSVPETLEYLDIYLLDPESASGWQTMQGAGQTKFKPLYAYFVNNKTDSVQTLRLNYDYDLSPVERLFQRTIHPGWNAVGIALPDNLLGNVTQTASWGDINRILDLINDVMVMAIDFTADQEDPESVKIGDVWRVETDLDPEDLNDLRTLTGYGGFIEKETSEYIGFQNINDGFYFSSCDENPTELPAGSQEQTLFKFQVDSLYDVSINSLFFSHNATGSVNDIDNFKIYNADSDELLGSVTNVDSDNNLIFSGLDISFNSESKRMKLVGNVTSSVVTDTTHQFSLKEAVLDHKIVVTGLPLSSNILTTTRGARLNVDLDSTAKETVDEVNNLVFGTFDFTVTAEDTRISTLIFNINESDGDSDTTNNKDIDDLELVDPNNGDRFTLTKSGGGDTNANDETWTCTDEIYLTKDVKRSLQVVGDLPSGIGNGDTYNIQMTVSTANLDAEGVISGDTVSDFSVSSLTGKLVTVVSPKLTIIPQPMNPGDAVIDAEDIVLFEGILDANNASAITIDRMKFESDGDNHFDSDNIDRVVLYTPLGEEQVITSVTDGEADFNAISINVPAGGQMTFGVKVDIAHTLDVDGPYRHLHLKLTGVTSRDEDGDSVTAYNEDGLTPVAASAATNNRTITICGVGSLKLVIPTDDSEVKYDRYALGGTAVEWVGKLKVRAENEAVNIEDMTFFNASDEDTDSVATIELYESDKTTKIAQTLLTTYGSYNVAAFTDLDYEVSEGGSTDLWVKANLRKIGTGSGDTADSGDALQFRVVADSVVARGTYSGTLLAANATPGEGKITCDADNDGIYASTTTGWTKETGVVGSKITSVDLVETASAYGESIANSLSGGDNKIAILKVETANTQNTDNTGDLLDVVMNRFRFKVTKEASTTINSVTVKRLGGSGNAEALNATDTNYYATSGSAFTDATDVKISSGETAYFLVTANLSLGGNRDWVQVDLDALDTATTANIHWADGDTTHGGGGVGPATYKTLRLGYTSVDGTKILEPYGS